MNDIVVLPKVQDQGRGSALLHAPLTYGGFEPDKAVALDAFRGNQRVNSWFERLGLVPTGVYKSVVLAGCTLEQIAYVTPPFVTLEDVAQRLETAHAWLQTGAVQVP